MRIAPIALIIVAISSTGCGDSDATKDSQEATPSTPTGSATTETTTASTTTGSTSQTGTFIANGVLTINGSNFGEKADPSPFSFDGCEPHNLGDRAIDVCLDDLGSGWLDNVTIQDDQVMVGAKSVRGVYTNGGGAQFPRMGLAFVPDTGDDSTGYLEMYSAVWVRFQTTDMNNYGVFKLLRGGVYPAYSGFPKFTHSVFAIPQTVGNCDGYDDSGAFLLSPRDPAGNGPLEGEWTYLEYYMRFSDPGADNGALQNWVNRDNTRQMNNTALPNRLTGSTATIQYLMSVFDGLDGYDGSMEIWQDGWYVSLSNTGEARMRVELGDAPTYAASTIVAPQPALTWTDTQITATVNAGGLASGTQYAYIIGADGLPIDTNGIAVSLP